MLRSAPPVPPLKIACLSVVKNEADIIEQSVRHNRQFCDLMCYIDNNSSDGTRSILRALQKEGLPLIILDDPHLGHGQCERLTALMRQTLEAFPADAILFMDGDEFLTAPSREYVEKYLRTIKPGEWLRVPMQTYVVNKKQRKFKSGADPLRYLTSCRVNEQALTKQDLSQYKAILRCNSETAHKFKIIQGNHMIVDLENQRTEHRDLPKCAIAHFPVRSPDQIQSKILAGWMAHLAMAPNAADGPYEFHWRDLYFRFMGGENLTAKELHKISLNYALHAHIIKGKKIRIQHKPFKITYRQKYRHFAVGTNALVSVTKTAEQFLSNPEDMIRLDLLGKGKERKSSFQCPLDLPPLRGLLERGDYKTILNPLCGQGEYIRALSYLGWQQSTGLSTSELNVPPSCQVNIFSMAQWFRHIGDQMYDVGFLRFTANENVTSIQEALHIVTKHCQKRILVVNNGYPTKEIKRLFELVDDSGWKIHRSDTALTRFLASTTAFRNHAWVFAKPSKKKKEETSNLPQINENLPPFAQRYVEPAQDKIFTGTELPNYYDLQTKTEVAERLDEIKQKTRKRAGNWLADQLASEFVGNISSKTGILSNNWEKNLFGIIRSQERTPRTNALSRQMILKADIDKPSLSYWDNRPSLCCPIKPLLPHHRDESFEIIIEPQKKPKTLWSEIMQIGDSKETHRCTLYLNNKRLMLTFRVEKPDPKNAKRTVTENFVVPCGATMLGHRDHLVAVFSSELGIVQIYLNGVSVSCYIHDAWKMTSANKIWLASRSFTGHIYLSLHYDGLLSEKEIAQLYKQRAAEFDLIPEINPDKMAKRLLRAGAL